MTKHFNRLAQKSKRRQLRNNATETERLLWNKLKMKQLCDVKFRRQYSVDAFVVDFYAPSLKLAIEIDGPSHFQEGVAEYDESRTRHLERFGITVVRFTNEDIYENIDGVLLKLEKIIVEVKTTPSAS